MLQVESPEKCPGLCTEAMSGYSEYVLEDITFRLLDAPDREFPLLMANRDVILANLKIHLGRQTCNVDDGYAESARPPVPAATEALDGVERDLERYGVPLPMESPDRNAEQPQAKSNNKENRNEQGGANFLNSIVTNVKSQAARIEHGFKNNLHGVKKNAGRVWRAADRIRKTTSDARQFQAPAGGFMPVRPVAGVL